MYHVVCLYISVFFQAVCKLMGSSLVEIADIEENEFVTEHVAAFSS